MSERADRLRETANKAVREAEENLSNTQRAAAAVEIAIQVEETPPAWINTLKTRVSPNSVIQGTDWQGTIHLWAKMIDYPYYLLNGRIFSTKFSGFDTGLTENDLK